MVRDLLALLLLMFTRNLLVLLTYTSSDVLRTGKDDSRWTYKAVWVELS